MDGLRSGFNLTLTASMSTFTKQSRESQSRRSADGFSSVDGHDQTALQREGAAPEASPQQALQETLNGSPKVQTQLQLQRSFNRSSRVVAQAKLAEALNSPRGNTLQPQQPVQRQEAGQRAAAGFQPAGASPHAAAVERGEEQSIEDNPVVQNYSAQPAQRTSAAPSPPPRAAAIAAPVVQRWLKADVVNTRLSRERIEAALRQNQGAFGGLGIAANGANSWTLDRDGQAFLTINFVFNVAAPPAFDLAARTMTFTFDNANDADNSNQPIFEEALAEQIDNQYVQHFLNQPVGGVFSAASVDNDPTHINHNDRRKLQRLNTIAGAYLGAVNAARDAPTRLTAQAEERRLVAQVASMGLATPAKLTALEEQDAVDFAEDRLRLISSFAQQQAYDASEAAAGAIANPGGHRVVTPGLIEHLNYPVPNINPVGFTTMGIGGGHDDQKLNDFVAANPNFRIERDFQETVQVGGQPLTIRMYSQYLRQPAGWLKSNVKKTTFDNLNLMLRASKSAYLAWVAAGNVPPGAGASFGRFSDNAAPEAVDAGTGLKFGGYGALNPVHNLQELQTLFVTDDWVYGRMKGQLENYMGENKLQVLTAYIKSPQLARTQLLADFAAEIGRDGRDAAEAELAALKKQRQERLAGKKGGKGRDAQVRGLNSKIQSVNETIARLNKYRKTRNLLIALDGQGDAALHAMNAPAIALEAAKFPTL